MNRHVLIGCGAAFLVAVILVGVLILETPKFFERGKTLVKKVVADEQRITLLEAHWQPPTPAPDGQWFPQTIGERRLERSEPIAGIPELDLDRAGHRGRYRSSQGSVEVAVILATDLEKAALIKRAEVALSNRGRSGATSDTGGVTVSVNRSAARLTTTRGNRTSVRMGKDDYTRFWWVKGSLFIFRAHGAADSESFPEEFLRALTPERAF